VPELPDVEGFRRLLRRHALGQRIVDVEVRDAGVIRGRTAADFVRRLVGRELAEPRRAGKWLLAPTDGAPVLLLHFGMTGSLVWSAAGGEDPYDRVMFDMGAGRLAYRDQRKLRGLWLAENDEEVRSVIGRQGPDALGLACSQLRDRLAGHRGGLKALLMDQSVVAGLGNMLSDEALWRAGIHPARRFDTLDAKEVRRLSRCLQNVLRTSVDQAGIPRSKTWLSSQRQVHPARCPRCRGELRTSHLAGRTSYWCPACQPEDG
jgi:formamidopyrimidine-DNA glycosylase